MEEFYPDKKLLTMWQVILVIWFFVLYVPIQFGLFVVNVVVPEKDVWGSMFTITMIEVPIAVFCFFWLPYYFKSLKYTISDDFMRIQSGVIWKRLITIPYEKVQNVEVHQGPLERNFALGKVLIHTAGFSGQTTAEGIIKGIINFQHLASVLTERVKTKIDSVPLKNEKVKEMDLVHILKSIRDELIEIKKILSNK
jgi:membrane protein YdbS with pleckstrin-like domain